MYKTNDSDINSTRNKNQSFLKDNKISVAKRNTDQARLDVHTAQYEATAYDTNVNLLKKKNIIQSRSALSDCSGYKFYNI